MLQIKNEPLKRPFCIKDKGQFYVRIKNSSTPASRFIVLNLFLNSVESIKNIQKLKSTSTILKNELEETIGYISSIHNLEQSRPSKIDSTFIRDAIFSNYAFLMENNSIANSPEKVTKMLTTIGKLNEQIDAYNTILNSSYKLEIQHIITGNTNVLSSDIREIPNIQISTSKSGGFYFY